MYTYTMLQTYFNLFLQLEVSNLKGVTFTILLHIQGLELIIVGVSIRQSYT